MDGKHGVADFGLSPDGEFVRIVCMCGWKSSYHHRALKAELERQDHAYEIEVASPEVEPSHNPD